jgi:hypothetical protein
MMTASWKITSIYLLLPIIYHWLEQLEETLNCQIYHSFHIQSTTCSLETTRRYIKANLQLWIHYILYLYKIFYIHARCWWHKVAPKIYLMNYIYIVINHCTKQVDNISITVWMMIIITTHIIRLITIICRFIHQ